MEARNAEAADRGAELITAAGVAAAAEGIAQEFADTPQYVSPALSRELGAEVVIKVETANPIRSFKGRGGDWLVGCLPDPTPLACASAGNFGQGVAYAARRRGLEVHVFAAEGANAAKVSAMRDLGADVRLAGGDLDEAKDHARTEAARRGWRFVEDGAEPAVTEGAGTIAVELCRWPEPFDAIVVPVGNGALIGGVGTWMRAVAPATEVIGVVASAAPAMLLSWRGGRAVSTPEAATVADGIAVRVPVDRALGVMADVVDDVVEVGEATLREAADLVSAATGLLAEPAGSAGFAALLADPSRWRGRRVAIPLCGSNVRDRGR